MPANNSLMLETNITILSLTLWNKKREEKDRGAIKVFKQHIISLDYY
jgi:hypothetical protein